MVKEKKRRRKMHFKERYVYRSIVESRRIKSTKRFSRLLSNEIPQNQRV